MSVSFLISVATGVVSVGGVLFLGLGLAGTTVLYFIRMTGGIGNSLLPLIKPRKSGAESRRPADASGRPL
jgi:hypothetical protein